jgi:hypothetical protein
MTKDLPTVETAILPQEKETYIVPETVLIEMGFENGIASPDNLGQGKGFGDNLDE